MCVLTAVSTMLYHSTGFCLMCIFFFSLIRTVFCLIKILVHIKCGFVFLLVGCVWCYCCLCFGHKVSLCETGLKACATMPSQHLVILGGEGFVSLVGACCPRYLQESLLIKCCCISKCLHLKG